VFALDASRVFLEKDQDMLLINLSAVVSATFSPSPLPIPVLPEASVSTALAREKLAFRTQEERLLRAGPAGTSKAEQEIFDTLAKTFDCRWSGSSIEEKKLGIIIKRPFREQDVSGHDAKAVARVRQVLASIRAKQEKR
jgi:hypothetical protein